MARMPLGEKSKFASVELQYLGVGGWLMSWRGHRILTAPFFSNPSLITTGFGRIQCRTELVDRFLPDISDVTSILAGHSHYDHLLDIPYILRAHAPKATIYGNATMRHILTAAVSEERLFVVDELAGDHVKMGIWKRFPEMPIRFMPLRSEHAPHFFGIKLYCGNVNYDLQRLPDRASGWKEGQTFAFLIDFLNEDDSVALRLHYQDAASTPPLGFPPSNINGDPPIDVSITCLASFQQVNGYPERLLQYLQPTHVFAGHWEDFFRPQTLPVRVVPLSDAREFERRVQAAAPKAMYHRLQPGQNFHIEIARS